MSTVQNGRQHDLSTQVERVKRKTRPWKSMRIFPSPDGQKLVFIVAAAPSPP